MFNNEFLYLLIIIKFLFDVYVKIFKSGIKWFGVNCFLESCICVYIMVVMGGLVVFIFLLIVFLVYGLDMNFVVSWGG